MSPYHKIIFITAIELNTFYAKYNYRVFRNSPNFFSRKIKLPILLHMLFSCDLIVLPKICANDQNQPYLMNCYIIYVHI